MTWALHTEICRRDLSLTCRSWHVDGGEGMDCMRLENILLTDVEGRSGADCELASLLFA